MLWDFHCNSALFGLVIQWPLSVFFGQQFEFSIYLGPRKLTWQTEKQEWIKMYLSLIKLVTFHCCVSFRGCSWSTTPFPVWHEAHFFVVSVWRGGVGWGGDVTVPWTCTHGRCYVFCGVWGGVGMLPFLELAHMVVATCLVSFFVWT